MRSTIVMIGVLGLIAFVELLQVVTRRESLRIAWPVMALSFFAMAAGAFWVFGVAENVGDYLGPHLTGGFDELRGILERKQGGRQLFAKSTAPFYERRLAFVAPALVGIAAVIGLWRLRRAERLRPMVVAVVALGLIYFPSVPFMLTAAGAEGARRSWAFTYIGVALLAAIGIGVLLERIRRHRRPRLARVGLSAAVLTLLIGNVASGLSVEYRFPGPFVFGSDTRSLTPELIAAQEWFTDSQGTGRRIVTDRASGLAFAQLGLNWNERAWAGFPLWDFYFKPERPEPAVLRSMEFLGTQFLVVDKRMPLLLPRTGVYVIKNEPGARAHVTPPPGAAIEKYRRVPWTIKVFESDNYEVYRLDYDVLDTCGDQAPEPGARMARCR